MAEELALKRVKMAQRFVLCRNTKKVYMHLVIIIYNSFSVLITLAALNVIWKSDLRDIFFWTSKLRGIAKTH